MSLALVRQTLRKLPGVAVIAEGRLRQAILDALPFSLTASQQIAVHEILADMAGTDRMLRLLQGDVGSGKTAVAMLAMADAVEAGGQAVLMAAHRNPRPPALCDHRQNGGGGRHRGRGADLALEGP